MGHFLALPSVMMIESTTFVMVWSDIRVLYWSFGRACFIDFREVLEAICYGEIANKQ